MFFFLSVANVSKNVFSKSIVSYCLCFLWFNEFIYCFTGKRPRDLLNPKAVKYMQEIFSVKDSISKKECRDISAQFGITVTQVIFSFECLESCFHHISLLLLLRRCITILLNSDMNSLILCECHIKR